MQKRNLPVVLISLFTMCLLALPGLSCGADLLTESDEYKDKEFVKGVIEDYSDMKEGGDISWVWIDPNVKLAGNKIKISSFVNKSSMRKKSLTTTVDKIFNDAFGDIETNGNKGTLTTNCAIYMAELANMSKVWIPFVGMHKAQAGIGVEMVFMNNKGKVVAKIRHTAREGLEIEKAAEEAADDIVKFIMRN